MADSNYTGPVKAPGHAHVLQAADARTDEARRALREILGLQCSGCSVLEATRVGNRAIFALQVLNDDTSFDKQTVTVSVQAEK